MTVHFFEIVSPDSAAHEQLRLFLTSEDKSLERFKQCSEFLKLIDMLRKNMDNATTTAYVLSLCGNDSDRYSIEQLRTLNPLIGATMGELLVQNENGDKVISVYDRDRLGSMFEGARYHQTREGGSIHTDNVNIPQAWDYLLLSCLSQGEVGGENIIVDGINIQKQLKERFPKALQTLEENFMWEMRGVKDALYEAPIITYNEKGLPLFRHLRPYMESAHRKAARPLTKEQLYALDVLDALTNTSENQVRYRMAKGDILINIDAQVLHGRTCFSDAYDAVNFDEFLAGKGHVMKRTMERLWIRK